jgi:hypothetical protein
MRRQIAALLVGVFMVPQMLSGQLITPGSRVRVSHPGEGTRTGTLVALTADTLEVRLAGSSESARLPLAEVTRLDVSRGTQRHMRRAGVGFVVGAGLGAVMGALGGINCRPDEWCFSSGEGALLGAGTFGIVGGAIGLIAGVIPSEKWERVPLPDRRISLVAPSGGYGRGVGLRFAF